MKTARKLGTIEAPIIIRNSKLNKENNADFLPEKMEKARQIIARAGLPPIKRQKLSSDTSEG